MVRKAIDTVARRIEAEITLTAGCNNTAAIAMGASGTMLVGRALALSNNQKLWTRRKCTMVWLVARVALKTP